jgi:hypothetical protein
MFDQCSARTNGWLARCNDLPNLPNRPIFGLFLSETSLYLTLLILSNPQYAVNTLSTCLCALIPKNPSFKGDFYTEYPQKVKTP